MPHAYTAPRAEPWHEWTPMRFTISITVTAMALLLPAAQAAAQPADPLRSAVEKAVQTHPDVTARLAAFRAAADAVDLARSAY